VDSKVSLGEKELVRLAPEAQELGKDSGQVLRASRTERHIQLTSCTRSAWSGRRTARSTAIQRLSFNGHLVPNCGAHRREAGAIRRPL